MPIRILPPGIAAMIAAGEVIERPASAVRELLDNAIDAGATSIEVAVRGQKLQEIVVSDNGVGMGMEDLDLCLKHHATSKLTGNSVSAIPTLGFRGEALASIAAVSSVTVISRPKGQDVAFQVSKRASEDVGKLRPVAGGFGTRVTVSDLFFNHPARLKFLKSDRVEKAWVIEVVERAALAHPEIEFIVSTGGDRRRFAPGDFERRMKDVLSKDFAADAVVVKRSDEPMCITGLVPLPGAVTSSGARQVFVVNGRTVSDRTLSGVVSSVYRSLIGTKETPSCVLHLSVPFDQVDVNVHPQKSEVSFLHPDHVSAFVRTAVERALDDAGLRTPSAVFDLARKLTGEGADSDVADRRRLPLGRFMGQAGSKWLVSETADGVAFVDQHAAHERVVLERLKAAVHGGDEDMVRVNPPVSRELSSMQAAVLSQNIETLRDLGFSTRLSGDTAMLDGYPAILSGCVPSELFGHLVDICLRGVAGGIVGEALWETLATAACKAAIKAGDALDPERADRLLREIEATPNAAQCNHGRPTMIFLKHEDIARLFGR
ncbi:DNA mismatch repair endonuclease MutL [Pararhizobium sp. BT-229]|uniref:DNA mismatch repair endonuclease MutL n=1 Tax=Pararhizobium sp. BT-229 TaxID=2986923 RepID=UPI0021F7C827|nr:DNA mismatch repair endonuclease MutL [Pararhizobium sp. BT-229]MCV9963528.1 DNA mismatch repair endonuclease MutL [Pararhizobium sp. BT-229]